MSEFLDLLHRCMRYAHIGVGFVGLVVFWIPVFAKKGSRLHIRCGRLFIWAAYFVGTTALVSSFWALIHPTSFVGPRAGGVSEREMPYLVEQVRFIFSILAYLSLAVLCGSVFAVRAVRTRNDHQALGSPTLIGLEFLYGAVSLALAAFAAWNLVRGYSGHHLLPAGAAGRYWVPLALGLLGLLSVHGDLQYIRQPRPTPMAWWYKHMENTLGVGIGFHTAFLVFGVNRLLPIRLGGAWQILPWVLPTVIGLPVISLWVRYYRRKFEGTGTPPGPEAASSSDPTIAPARMHAPT